MTTYIGGVSPVSHHFYIKSGEEVTIDVYSKWPVGTVLTWELIDNVNNSDLIQLFSRITGTVILTHKSIYPDFNIGEFTIRTKNAEITLISKAVTIIIKLGTFILAQNSEIVITTIC